MSDKLNKTLTMNNVLLDPGCMLLDTYRVYLGNSFVAEVQKKGTRVGIYTLTTRDRKRGVVLPVEVWRTLDASRDIIKTAIDICGGGIQTYRDEFAETFTNQTHYPNLDGAASTGLQESYIFDRCGELRFPASYTSLQPTDSIAENFFATTGEKALCAAPPSLHGSR